MNDERATTRNDEVSAHDARLLGREAAAQRWTEDQMQTYLRDLGHDLASVTAKRAMRAYRDQIKNG